MSTRLERFLAGITPIPDRIDLHRDWAVVTFRSTRALLTEVEEVSALLAAFYCHLECAMMGIPARSPDSREDFRRCDDLLRKKYGRDAFHAAVEIARSGAEGGVRQLLLDVANRYSEKYAEDLIDMAVEAYIQECSAEDYMADVAEYMQRFEQVLSPGITRDLGSSIRTNFKGVLKQHPFFMRELRQRVNCQRG